MSQPALAQQSCGASIDPTILTPPDSGSGYYVGTTLTVNLALRAQTIQGGTYLEIPSVRYALDCIGPGTIIDTCVDETSKITYLGDATLSTNCGVSVSSNVPGGGAGTNIVVFTFTPALQLGQGLGCNVTFNAQIIEEPSADATPQRIEEAAGFDGTCDNELPGSARGGVAIEVLFCGDEIVGNTPGETCDPPGSSVGSGETCRDDCTYCGDGILDAGEQCDDGNEIDGDGCDADCTPTPTCGDGIVGNTPGETCDPPGSPVGGPGETCRDDCTYCGDGVVDMGEQCDDGNVELGDGCDAACHIEPGVIPTVSEWGLIVMALLLMTGLKIEFGWPKRVPI